MEQQPQPSSPLFQLNVDANTGYTLRSAASWAKILGILGIIFGLCFIGMGILMQNTMNQMGGAFDEYKYRGSASMMGNVAMIMYILIGVITMIGSLFALSFGNRVTTAIRTNDQNTLRAGFAGVRNYFAYWTILMIIGLLILIIGLATGASSGLYS